MQSDVWTHCTWLSEIDAQFGEDSIVSEITTES